jgi:peptidoglycan hydrolase-like protein with peptidoglycan-binding domain
VSAEPEFDYGPERLEPVTQLSFPRRKVPVKWLVMLLVIAVAGVGVIFYVSERQKSPADASLARKPPIVKPVTAQLVRQVLEVSFSDPSASYRYGDLRPVSLAGSVAKTGVTQVVTQAPVQGQVVEDNKVVMTVTGRPVIVVQVDPVSGKGQPCSADVQGCSVTPMYRDLRPGDQGQDVTQLQTALKRLGYFDAEVNGRYGPTTAASVAEWYQSLGLEPFGMTDVQRKQLRGLNDAFTKATEQAATAQAALDKAVNPGKKDVLTANEQVRLAQEKLTATRDTAIKALATVQAAVTAKQTAVDNAVDEVDASKAALDKALLAIRAAVTAKQTAVDNAVDDVAAAQANLEKVQRDATDSSAADQSDADLLRATNAVAEAQITIDKNKVTVTDGQATVTDLQAALVDSQGALQDAKDAASQAQAELAAARIKPVPSSIVNDVVTLDTDAQAQAIRTAEASVRSATATIRGAEAGVRAAQRAVERAQTAVADAETQVVKAQATKTELDKALLIAKKKAERAQGPAPDRVVTLQEAQSRIRRAQAALTLAKNELDAAQKVEQTQAAAPEIIETQSRVRRAQNAVVAANADLKLAETQIDPTRRSYDAQVRADEAALRIAEAARDELLNRAEIRTAKAQLKSAEQASAQATADLAEAKSQLGVIVPANEVVFFNELPMRIDEAVAKVGSTVASDAVFKATSTQLVIASAIPVDKIQYVTVGMNVSLIDQNGEPGTGTVKSIATKPGGTAPDGLYAVDITTTSPPPPPTNAMSQIDPSQLQFPSGSGLTTGAPLTVNYPTKRSATPLLAVPATGLYKCETAPPGTECVKVINGDNQKEVRVTRIMDSSTGLVGIEPQPAGALKEGDRVAINNPAPSSSDIPPGPEDLGKTPISPAK